MRVPQLEKEIGCPQGWRTGVWIIGAGASERINLCDIREVFHAVGGPECSAWVKLDPRWDRVGVRLIDNCRSDRENVMRRATHMNIRKDQSGSVCVLARYSTTGVLAKRSTQDSRL